MVGLIKLRLVVDTTGMIWFVFKMTSDQMNKHSFAKCTLFYAVSAKSCNRGQKVLQRQFILTCTYFFQHSFFKEFVIEYKLSVVSCVKAVVVIEMMFIQ